VDCSSFDFDEALAFLSLICPMDVYTVCGKANRDFFTKIEFFREENVPANEIQQ
jgi:hypothetical protein